MLLDEGLGKGRRGSYYNIDHRCRLAPMLASERLHCRVYMMGKRDFSSTLSFSRILCNPFSSGDFSFIFSLDFPFLWPCDVCFDLDTMLSSIIVALIHSKSLLASF